MPFLTRTDPTRNIDRFYVVQVMPGLFGDCPPAPAAVADAVFSLSK